MFSLARGSRCLLPVGILSIALIYSIAAVGAAEIVVKNDTVFGPGYPALPHPFVNTEEPNVRVGSYLTSPIDGVIVGVQIAWGSETGNAAPHTGAAIRISEYDPNLSKPQAGATKATIVSPVLVDGMLNEYRFLDPATGLVPLAVPIAAGENFLVDLELLEVYARFDTSAPGVLMDPVFEDRDVYRDLVFLPNLPLYWFPTLLAISPGGNFGIRAIIQPVPEPSSYALAASGLIALVVYRRRVRG